MEKQKTTFIDLLKHMITATIIFFLGMIATFMLGFAEGLSNLALDYDESREYRKTLTNYTNSFFEDNKRLNNELLTTLNESNNWKEAYNLCQQDNFRLYEKLNN